MTYCNIPSYKNAGGSFLADRPRIYTTKSVGFGTTRPFEPALDGKSVVALTPADPAEGARDRLVFLVNFLDELRRRVPVGH
jgi:hypothetical protein